MIDGIHRGIHNPLKIRINICPHSKTNWFFSFTKIRPYVYYNFLSPYDVFFCIKCFRKDQLRLRSKSLTDRYVFTYSVCCHVGRLRSNGYESSRRITVNYRHAGVDTTIHEHACTRTQERDKTDVKIKV